MSRFSHIPAMVREYNAGDCAANNTISIALRFPMDIVDLKWLNQIP